MKEAKRQSYRPSPTCILCDKTIEAIGGKRIIAQKSMAVFLSEFNRGNGSKEYPYRSFKLDDKSGKYIVVWGRMTDSIVEKARIELLNGLHPWFCQHCGNRECRVCGSPVNYPVGCDTIDDSGTITHSAIFPANCGCSNPNCEDFKALNE